MTSTSDEGQCAGREPLRYTSKNKKSNRYAAPGLVVDLRKHNLTGINMKCPAFLEPIGGAKK